jgi:predicted RNase H-like nuclease (RuvC/YqgF family)
MNLLPQLIMMALTALITWLVTRTKQNAETKKIEGETLQGVIKMWQNLVEDLTKEVKELTLEVKQLREENAELKFDIQNLEKHLQK